MVVAMASPRLLLLVVAVALFLSSPCHAIYEDQVGVRDWHQQYIGRVKHAVFQTQGAGRKRVVVATEENALASLNLRTGEIYWRHVFGATDSIDALEVSMGKYVITLSKGHIVRAWHLPDGALLWETRIHANLGFNLGLVKMPVDIDDDKINDLLVFSGSFLTAISGADGTLLWQVDAAASKNIFIEKVVLPTEESKAYGVGFYGINGLALVEIDLKTGDLSELKTAETAGILSTDHLHVTKDFAVALHSDAENLVVALINPSSESLTLVETPVRSLLTNPGTTLKLLSTKLEGAISLSSDDQTVILAVDSSSGKLSLVERLTGAVTVSDSLSVLDEKHATAMIEFSVEGNAQNVFNLRVHGTDFSDEIQKETVKLPSHRGFVQKVFLNAYVRTDRSHGFRALVVGEDDSLSLLQQGEVVWTREDGLASIVEATTAELPLERDGVSVAEVEHDLAEWLKGHIMKLKATLFLATPDELAAVQKARLNLADKTKPTRDHNGFRKLLLVLTKSGKISALHTGDGHVVWSLLVPSLRASYGGPAFVPRKLLQWQVPHQHALDENPVVLIIAQADPGYDVKSALSWVDAHKGTELQSVKLSFPVMRVVSIPLTDSSEQRLHLLIDNLRRGHLFPATEESLALFLKYKENAYFYEVDDADQKMHGYGMKDLVDPNLVDIKEGYVFETEKLWSIVFPSETEAITAVVTRRPDEVSHTQTKVLPNRDVLFKYLNKNLVFVATVTPKNKDVVGTANPEDSTLVAYLIDTVSGRILHRISHPNMQGPVHAVVSENWVVYHYFNLRQRRYEMSVLEIYDQSRLPDKGVVQLMLGQHNSSVPISSYSPINLEVKGQSYYFTFTLKSMAVTSTAKGITAKQLLLGTVTDQVLALDKRLFDPRRTPTPTPAELEEGLLPLTDSIPINPQSYLTHSYQVEGLRGMLTIPARLESTSLVFAYGLDLFYTHTAPSKIYDSLTEDFSYALLLITIIALLVAIVVTYVLSERRELAEKWK
ncbi:hypothetical protein M758_3G216900 [Ceratodon purpureus]|nr:hypothetical protein M758_3G216900 [Ceratodon purpureus]